MILRSWRLPRDLFVALATLQVWDGVQSTMLGALRGMSDTAWPAMVSLVAYWLVALPAGWVFAFPLGFGPAGVWLGFGVALAAASVALTLRFRARTKAPAGIRPAPPQAEPAAMLDGPGA
jgi:multidrug resistance protein, MATE family